MLKNFMLPQLEVTGKQYTTLTHKKYLINALLANYNFFKIISIKTLKIIHRFPTNSLAFHFIDKHTRETSNEWK